ncbi:hypothetical protein ABN028_05315 [Actinopolymorpha sp. B17G11]|uniref:hypothetical protein n=1 Tax=unclassified Actinopolymorpha TaxID=2627063 RepID=UPI0032D8D163
MAEPYTYQIDLFDKDAWRTSTTAQDRTVGDRASADIARAILEDWIIDHPSDLAGGGRVTVFDDPSDYPPDEGARVRVLVFREVAEDSGPAQPAAAAYLLADPDAEDPHAWVNP